MQPILKDHPQPSIKIAYIILAHKYPKQLERLVLKLSAGGISFFIHIDKKTDRETYAEMVRLLSPYENVHFLNRFVCDWGGYGHVEATMEGIRRSLATQPACDYVILLTGQDYPIKSNDYIREYLNERKGQSFIEFYSLPDERWKAENGGLDRTAYWHVHWFGHYFVFLKKDRFHAAGLNQIWRLIALILALPRNSPGKIQLYGGSAYWCLTRTAAEGVIEFVKHNTQYDKFFRYALLPEEEYFQTILLNSDIRNNMVNDNLRFIAWSDSPHPAIFRRRNFEELIHSGKLFARKFDLTLDPDLLDLIDQAGF